MVSAVGTVVVEALRRVLAASPDVVIAIASNDRVVFANARAQERWSVLAAENETPLETVLPADALVILRAALATVRNGAATHCEWNEQTATGRTWLRASLYAVDGVVLCTASDVTESKRIEERLRRSESLMVDTQGVAHLGTWDWDIAQPHAVWSAELYRIYGLTPETYTPSYEAYLQMVHPDDRQRVMDATNRVFHEHIPYSHDERIYRPDGSLRHLHTWAHPVLDGSGTLRALVGVCQDITDQKIAEAQIRELNSDLERRVAERTRTLHESMRDLETFNAMVSHDLRAPLANLQLITDLVQSGSDVTANVPRIRRAVAQMKSIIDDLLTLARVGQAPFERTEVDLSELAHEALEELRQHERQRDVVIAVEPGLRCRADRGLMRAVLTNLLSNAWKYSAQAVPARVTVGVTATEPREFFVRDNGVGFDMKEERRLFVPFERLHRADDFEGTGIGLTIVQRIVERHGGHVRAESAPGQGATFYFALPT